MTTWRAPVAEIATPFSNRWRSAPAMARGLIVLAVAASLAASFLVGSGVATARAAADAGADLTRLLRGMAAIKAMMAAAVAGAVLWRLGSPVGPWRLAAYGLGCAAMAAGPGLIWSLTALGPGALLLHGGLLATLAMLWRDPAMAARLAGLVAARRAHDGRQQDRRRGPRGSPVAGG